MSEMPSCEEIVNELRDEALKYPHTGWLSDLARRDLTWDGQNEIIVIGAWYGSVDVGHLAAIVESLIDKKTQDLTTRLEQAEQQVARVQEVASGWATRDRQFREAILNALDGETNE
ncbi:hypothetical protein ABZ820_33335 [Streptomyces diacarni]|uniref:hypothetical protein n=1 Tax=Streptomyces diacarni TaxID=2800381 RepID=UPI0033FE55A4